MGILRLYAPRLSQMTIDNIAPFLMRLPEDINASNVFRNVAEIRISHSNYSTICKRFGSQTGGTEEAKGTFHKISEIILPDSSAESTGIKKGGKLLKDFVSSFLPAKRPSSR